MQFDLGFVCLLLTRTKSCSKLSFIAVLAKLASLPSKCTTSMSGCAKRLTHAGGLDTTGDGS